MILFKKCAVAFFFLFFLHGTSIGNGQQGISYNVPQIPEEGDFKIQNFQLTMNLNRSTKSDITTKPPFLGMCCYVSVFF